MHHWQNQIGVPVNKIEICLHVYHLIKNWLNWTLLLLGSFPFNGCTHGPTWFRYFWWFWWLFPCFLELRPSLGPHYWTLPVLCSHTQSTACPTSPQFSPLKSESIIIHHVYKHNFFTSVVLLMDMYNTYCSSPQHRPSCQSGWGSLPPAQ